MKKIVVMLMAVLFTGGVAMAQNARCGDKMPDPKMRAERMTERMAKEYSLNDSQKKQLLEANLAFMQKVGDRPMHRRMKMRDCMNVCNDSCICVKVDKQGGKESKRLKKADKRSSSNQGPYERRKADKEKNREEMLAARAAYDAQLQKIMTKDQYAAYTKNMQERKSKMESKRKDVRK